MICGNKDSRLNVSTLHTCLEFDGKSEKSRTPLRSSPVSLEAHATIQKQKKTHEATERNTPRVFNIYTYSFEAVCAQRSVRLSFKGVPNATGFTSAPNSSAYC